MERFPPALFRAQREAIYSDSGAEYIRVENQFWLLNSTFQPSVSLCL